MSYLSPGLLEAYNSLTDRHLIGYFNNTRIRRHLRRAGLITRSGRIVPEKEYRQKVIHRAHQRHVRECLAQAIFHKVLDMERTHQTEIKKRLEEFARRERVYKIKVERSKRHDEDFIPMLSPRPPTGPRGNHTQQSGPDGEMSESSESPGSSRPNTAPGKMQRPVRLKPIDRNSTTTSVKKTPPSSRNQDSSNDTDQPLSLDRDMRQWTTREHHSTVSPYRLPVINNYVTPVPPLTKRRDRGMKGPLNGTRGRRLRPTTAPSVPANKENSVLLRTSMQSKVTVTMVYFGRGVHLSHDLMDIGDEVKAFQQHCGGENLCVYKGRLREGETFQFISRRHRGFPFSLTFYLNGLQVDRLSSCCEFKHRKGSRLGGRHGHFGFFSVDGAQPCYKCIIAMGLDKKPTPPPKRVSDDRSSPAIELCPGSAQVPVEVQEGRVEKRELETEPESIQPDCLKAEEEPMQDDQPKDDYEEDFEADDEGPIENGGEEANRKPASPTNEGKTEDEILDAPEGEPAEHNKYPDSEDEDKTDRRESISSRGASSHSGSDAEDSEVEVETKEDNAAGISKAPEGMPQAEPESEPEPPLAMETSEKDQQEDAEMTEVSSPVPPEAAAEAAVEAHMETEDSTGDNLEKTELEVSDSTEAVAMAMAEGEGTTDPAGGSAAESEPERAKSVQEKLAEAILNESHSSPEPELSDTSTEEEEEASVDQTPQDTSVVESDTSVALSLLQPGKEQDKECEEGSKEIAIEETGAQASEEREPSPENIEKQATDEQNVIAEQKCAVNEENVEPVDDSSIAALEVPANPEGEKKEEMESSETKEAPCEVETEAEKKEQDVDESAEEQAEESRTIANETASADLENNEEIAEEMKDTTDSEAPLEQQDQEEEDEKMDSSEGAADTAEGEPAVSETEAQKTSDEPSESVMPISEVGQSEEPSVYGTKRPETPDEQHGGAESETTKADDAIAHDDSTHVDKSTQQEPESSIVETSEKLSDTGDVVEGESGENSEKLVDTKEVESNESTVKNESDPQNIEEKEDAKEEKADNSDEGHNEVKQETAENESVAMDQEGAIVDELREEKIKPVEIENVETAQQQANVDATEQLEGDQVEEVANEEDSANTEDKKAENEVKAEDEDAKSCLSDVVKEISGEGKSNTEDNGVDGDERNSVSEGEKEKSVEGDGKEKMDVAEDEGKEAKTETAEPTAEPITEKETEMDMEVETKMDDGGHDGGDEVKEEEVDVSADGQVDDREVDDGQTGHQSEGNEEERKKESIKDGEEHHVGFTESENPEDMEEGGAETVDGAENISAAKESQRSKVDDQVGNALKDNNTNTKVGEVERSEKAVADDVEKNDSETCDGERGSSVGRKEDNSREKADECGGVSDDTRAEKRELRNPNESEADRDVNGEDKDAVMEFKMEETAVSGDGTESQHGDKNAEVKGEVIEGKIKRTPVFEFAISGVKSELENIEINDENGEKITASESTGDMVKKCEPEGQEPHQIIDNEQRDSSDTEGEEMKETKIEEIVGVRQNDVEEMNGDDTKSDRKLSSDESVETQVKVEDEKGKELFDAADGDGCGSVLSKTSKDGLNRQGTAKQDTHAAHVDQQVEETSTEIKPFLLIQEPEGLNTVHTNSTGPDVPGGAGSDLETKGHKRMPKDSEAKEDTSTKEGQVGAQELDSAEKEHVVNGEQSVAESLTSPLSLERQEVGDLVSKWVNQHQTRGCFQTFVEPLDDIKDTSSLSKGKVDVDGHLEKGEGSQSTNVPESDTLDQMSEMKEDYVSPPMSAHTVDKQETTVEDFVMETKEEKAESDVRSKHSNDESTLATKDMLEERQDKEIRDVRLTAETEYAEKDTASIATKDRENQPYEQGAVSDRVIDLIATTKTKDDSKPDSESSSESASHAKTDHSVHSGHAEDTTEKKQQLRFEDVIPQSQSHRLSTFSVEDSRLFGPTTYPRLATAHPEQSY
ncbi:glutamate-rich protein 3 isoform X2 [Alosa sapidissima]|uniref:glutamate-rich protein 3 isoform X2 n=1 Tax=Alosa sapidissima TaxID=34773 RepID=UPI001C0A5C6E|nr:glutamate-rich protein 3 isoform X2 [Alosa sapidissima]